MTALTMKSREARSKWRELLDQVLTGNDVLIERNGKPIAVMIPVADYEALLDVLDDLRAARQAGAIYKAWKKDPSTGMPWSEARAELVAEGLLDE